ncbi:hypothetical protein DVH05_010497 [Phytophthora capsici]|nr:hypothetical protein DVH05_011810 [Phytophthora capsici]KAG1692980.1 hypothetical protein DVH05_024016 [Phytophthora capsici]KAG1702008.1 hypothetical protein DVH05_010497 [Phytophthora capsici]
MTAYGSGDEIGSGEYREIGVDVGDQGVRTSEAPMNTERLEQMEARQRRALRARSSGNVGLLRQQLQQEVESVFGERRQSEVDGQVRATTSTGRDLLHDQVMTDLWQDEEEDEEKDVVADVGSEVEVKQEVKEEVSPRNSVNSSARIKTEPRTDEADAEYMAADEPHTYYEVVEVQDGDDEEDEYDLEPRRPSGFIARYTGPEKRRADRSSYGWSWRAADEAEDSRRSHSAQLKKMDSPRKVVKMVLVDPSKKDGTPRKMVKVVTQPMSNSKTASRTMNPFIRGTTTSGFQVVPASHGTGTRTVRATTSKGNTTTTTGKGVVREKNIGPVAMYELMANAVKLLPFFHSDSTTVEKARSFWEAFEAHTSKLPDAERLLVFQQKLKGKEADRWWGNSNIKTFDTLKARFHIHFLSRTQDELFDALFGIMRGKGESIEEWGDRVSDLCNTLGYPDDKFRYKVFRRGLRNKKMLAMLDSGPARNIPEACEWLMTKDMHRPIEEDEEFESSKAKANTSADSKPSAVEMLAQQMQSYMIQQQQWQEQLLQGQWPSPRAQQYAAAVPPPSVPVREDVPVVRGIRQEPDWRAQDGRIGCGRCLLLGCNRANCRRQRMKCIQCGRIGHIKTECEDETRGNQNTYSGSGRRSGTCFFCDEAGHMANECPLKEELRGLRDERRRQAGSTGSASAAPRPPQRQ